MSVHVAIIGAYGSAGVAAADELLERDPSVELTLIDDGDPGGGLCILRGCMPSKDVLSAGQHRYQARHDDRLEGVPEIDPEAVVARKNEHITGFAEHRRKHVHELAERETVEFVHDTARFVDDRVIELEESGRSSNQITSSSRRDRYSTSPTSPASMRSTSPRVRTYWMRPHSPSRGSSWALAISASNSRPTSAKSAASI